jgi:APA family basic amino acid/polyamine antiporter
MSTRPSLVRALGLLAAASLVVSNIIGQGIFLKARAMTCNVGSPTLVMTAWALAGVLALCGALTLAELSAMLPKSGGPYAFLRRAFGHPIAFAYGWMYFLLGGPLAAAALATGGAIFLNLLSGDALHHFEIPYGAFGLHGVLVGTQLAALALLAAVALVNLAPVRTNGALATVFAAVKILMLVALVIGAYSVGNGSWGHFAMSGAAGACTGITTAARGGAAGFGAAMLGALYAYQGWASLSYIAGEAKDPGRTIPRALITSMLVVIGLYVAANAAYFYVLSPVAVASVNPASSVGLEVLGHLFGPGAQGVATALLFVSVVATLHVSILTNSRITFAMAEDRDMVPWLSGVTTGTHVPGAAVVAGAIVAAVLVLLGSFDTLSDFQVFSVWIFYGLTGVSVFVLRRMLPDAQRPYRVFGYPIVPAIFVAATLWLLYEAIIGAPVRSLIGLGIIALALPVYTLLRRRARRSPV